MKWNNFRILGYFVIAAVIVGIICWLSLPAGFRWSAPVITLGLILIGTGINCLVLADRANSKIEVISEAIKHIEQHQEAIKNEQEKQAGAHTPIVATLQAFSQLYTDSLKSREDDEEQEDDAGDT